MVIASSTFVVAYNVKALNHSSRLLTVSKATKVKKITKKKAAPGAAFSGIEFKKDA
ncbi:MAG: hypothetical protein HY795_13440 [Desulfovibrio sp.]|nr:hypothetical protein [Desulfovibrio sp.]MBI4958677.1 hypothetical protein [Desulfovibrio sp.]